MTIDLTRSPSTADRHANPPPRLAAALAAAARGWPVFPLYPYSKVPAVKDWESQATTDTTQLTEWWTELPYNVGIACGPAGLVVIDLDVVHGPLPADWAEQDVTHGRDVLRLLAEHAGQPDPIDTYTVLTPGDGDGTGEHRYFLAPTDRELRPTTGHLGHGIGPGIDVRPAGGAVTAAGSVRRVNGWPRRYRVDRRRRFDPIPLPPWLVTRLTPPPPTPRAPVQLRGGTARLDAYVNAALTAEAANVHAAASGTRAAALFRSAAALGELVGARALTEQTAADTLLDAASVHTGVDGWTAREAEHHIRNGIARGRGNPRDLGDMLD